MKRIFIFVVVAVLVSSMLRAAVFPVDSDLWTEDSDYSGNWYTELKVDPYAPDVTYLYDGNAPDIDDANEFYFGDYVVEVAEVSSTYPFAYIEFQDGPIDLSAAYARVIFYFKFAASGNLPMQIRLYTDATGIYGSYFYMSPGSFAPNQWHHFNHQASAYSYTDGTPNLSHVYGIGFMAAPGSTTNVTFSFNGIHVIGQTTATLCKALYPADADTWTEDSDYASNWWVELPADPYDPCATCVTDGNAMVGDSYIKTAVVDSNWPFAYFEIPGGAPIDLSGADARVDFYLKINAPGTYPLSLRLYTDPTGAYGSCYTVSPGSVVPGQWERYDYLASDYSSAEGTPDLSHVYGIGFLACKGGAPIEASYEIDGLNFGKPALSHGYYVISKEGLIIDSIVASYTWGDINMVNWEASNFNSINTLWSYGEAPADTKFGYWLDEVLSNIIDYTLKPDLIYVQYFDEQYITGNPPELTDYASMISKCKALFPHSISYMNNSPAANYYQDVVLDINDLTNFKKIVEPEMLSLTAYPWRWQGTSAAQNYVGGSPTSYYKQLEMYRQSGLAGIDGTGQKPIPTGVYVQHYRTTAAGEWVDVNSDPNIYAWVHYFNTRVPSESELNLQTFAAWAFGFKKTTGFFYADGNNPDPTMANISFNGTGDTSPTAKFYEIASMNEESQNLQDALSRLLSTDVRMVMGGHLVDGNCVTNTLPPSTYSGTVLKAFDTTANPYMEDVYVSASPGSINGGCSGDVIIGFYRSLYDQPLDPIDTNETYFMVVNGLSDAEANSVACTQTIHIEFDFGTTGIGRLLRLNRTTGDWEVINDGPGHAWYYYGAGGRYYLELELGGGKGDLFKYYTFYGFLPPQSLTPRKATSPSPANSGTDINVTEDLSWTAGDGTTSHNVYFGTDSTPDETEYKGNQAGTTYDPGTLTANTIYYWRIDEVGTDGTTTGTVWSFTTTPPYFVAVGTAQSGTGNITVPWPTHQTGDVALLFIESCGGQAASLGTPAGFAAVTNSPQSTGTGTAGTRITVYWCRATSSSMASPVVTDPGDHVYGKIFTFRGVTGTGNPWDVTAGGVKATASTTTTFGTLTTSVNNELIVLAASRDNDSAAAAWSGWTNANLSNLTERSDEGTTQGNGGGIGVATGIKASAGAIGSSTTTVTSSVDGHMTIALKP